ncbi:MAG: ATPase, T2SS/T4P/T4SS family [Candidatus Hydrothermarchaeota archaeon]
MFNEDEQWIDCKNCGLEGSLINCGIEIIDKLKKKPLVFFDGYCKVYEEESVEKIFYLRDLIEKVSHFLQSKICDDCHGERKYLVLKLFSEENLEKREDLCKKCNEYLISLHSNLKAFLKNLKVSWHVRPYGSGRHKIIPNEEVVILDFYKIDDASVYILEGNEITYFLDLPEFHFTPKQSKIFYEVANDLTHQYREVSKIFIERSYELEIGEVEELIGFFDRFIAFGPLEYLMKDPKVLNIYVDPPKNLTPLYLEHSDFGLISSNLRPSYFELERWSMLISSICKRPFDSAHPVLDAEIRDSRIMVTRPPFTPDGISLSMRNFRSKPWTFPLLISKGMLDPFSAAFLDFMLLTGASMIIIGHRSAGKTSLLSALLAQLPKDERITVIEDTLELPVHDFKKCGMKILRSKIKSVLEDDDTIEMDAEKGLRAQLRAGESVIVVGEVRSKEAKILWEGQRIGASTKAVLGTLHAHTAKDCFERVVFDLNVPKQSFKATDLLISVSIKQRKKKYSRKLISIEEQIPWLEDPVAEEAFKKLFVFDEEIFSCVPGDLTKSLMLKEKSKKIGFKFSEAMNYLENRCLFFDEILDMGSRNARLLELDEFFRLNNLWHKFFGEKDIYSLWREEVTGFGYR